MRSLRALLVRVTVAGLTVVVLPTVAATIGAKDELPEHLRDKRMLLLLDNLEQVLSVAPKLGELLAQSPGVKLLTTSRERLSLAAEQEYSVPTLPLEDAVELFVARSRQLDPAFSADGAVAEICRRLDGLPLAVELAAARIKVLTPGQILNRLDRRFDTLRSTARDAPARQRTLRATIDWSYQLLAEEERALFARLAVFAGSFDLDGAEVVAQAELEVLESLVDKSLLRRTHEGRFFMLETIREYGLERFDESLERDEIRMRHAQHAIARAESNRDEELLPWLASIDPQYADLLAALTWLARREDSRDVVPLHGGEQGRVPAADSNVGVSGEHAERVSEKGRVQRVDGQGQREEEVRGFLARDRSEPLHEVVRDLNLDHRVDQDLPLHRLLDRAGGPGVLGDGGIQVIRPDVRVNRLHGAASSAPWGSVFPWRSWR